MLLSSQKSQKSVPGELSTQISDDAIGYAEAVDDLVEERDSLF